MTVYDLDADGPHVPVVTHDPTETVRTLIGLRAGRRGLDDVVYGYSGRDDSGRTLRADVGLSDLAALVAEVDRLRAVTSNQPTPSDPPMHVKDGDSGTIWTRMPDGRYECSHSIAKDLKVIADHFGGWSSA